VTAPVVLVVEQQQTCPPALFGEWLTGAGCELHVVRPWRGDDLPDMGDFDAVLVLGGEMSAHHDDTVAWLRPLKAAIAETVEAGIPLLGICLGHQLTALALGGRVVPNPRGQSLGVQPIGWTSCSAEDPLTADCHGEERAIHWNSDVVSRLPDSAVALALSPDGDPQVVHYGRRAWGIQAHPEVDGEVVRWWAEADQVVHAQQGVDQGRVLAAIDEAAPALARDWEPVARRFAAMARAQRVRRGRMPAGRT
jgi:GMP synthase (glutamine-hydrolysing)